MGAHLQSFGSSAASPSSPVFPHHHSLALNGQGTLLPSLRPGTSLGHAPASSTLLSSTSTPSPSSAPPPPDGLDYAALPQWTDTSVSTWLSAALPALSTSYADLFAKNDIRGSVLLEVDQSALKEMGVRSVGDRVKICVAVRALRGKYLAATGAAGAGRNSALGRVAVQSGGGGTSRPGSPLVNGSPSLGGGAGASSLPTSPAGSPPAPSVLAAVHGAGPGGVGGAGSTLAHSRAGSGSYSARSLLTGNRIPPPLHLAQSNMHHSQYTPTPSPLHPPPQNPQLTTPGQAQAQAHLTSPPSRATSPRSATFSPPSTTSVLRAPPAAPPTTRLPAPPTVSVAVPGTGGTPSLASLRSNSVPSSSSQHRKASSSSLTGAAAAAAASGLRPSTAGASYAGHPYASSASGLLPSPMDGGKSPASASTNAADGFSVGRSTFARPSTAGGVVSTAGVIPPSLSSSSSSSSAAPASRTLAGTVRFTSADGVTSRVLAVGDAKDGREVLERVMRKFGTTGAGGGGMSGPGAVEDVEQWGVWTVEGGGGARLLTEHELYQICQNSSAPERSRPGGLIVRRHHAASSSSLSAASTSTSPPSSALFASQPSSPSSAATSFASVINSSPSKRGRKLQWVFGESHAPSAELTRPGGTVAFSSPSSGGGQGQGQGASPTSPNYLGVEIPRMGGIEPATPPAAVAGFAVPSSSTSAARDAKDAASRAATTKMNRASTVSVMSGLEAPDWARDYYARGESGLGGAAGGGAGMERERSAERADRDGDRSAERRPSGAAAGAGGADGFRVASPPQRTSSRRVSPSAGPSASSSRYPASPPQRAPSPARAPSPPPPGAGAGADSDRLLPTSARKLRNFFGQRPPSELITNHLTEYFPLGAALSPGAGGSKERARLSKHVRASIRRSMSAAGAGAGAMGRRMSTASVASRASRASRASSTRAQVGTSWEKTGAGGGAKSVAEEQEGERGKAGGAAMSRFSGSSNGSAVELHITSAASSPSLPSTSSAGLPIPASGAGAGDASSIKNGRSPRSSSGSALDPPDEAEEEAEAEEGATSSPESTGMLAAPSSASASSAASSAGSTADEHDTDTAEGDPDADTRSIASSSLTAPSISVVGSASGAGGAGAGYLHPRRLSRRMSRLSGSSRLSVGAQSLWERRSKDSDAASIITMDEVTAELETRQERRASGVSWGATSEYSDEEAEGSGSEIEEEGEEGWDGSDGEEGFSEEEEEEMEEESEEEDEPGTAKPENRGMKWIKGALIGQGSFGSVYLGMNPMTGSLMAVKQVELPTGNSHNEERKKGMLGALEREIELLKVLQHDNIVQYLDSSTADKHLNIFLEYVPGGSVAALLQNYGAFEEALVSKFVRQILTGLAYLHEREIIHRDIKGANILVDNKGNIKISDFGISKKVEDNLLSGAKVHRPSLQGSVYWMAPEVVKQTAYTSKADIWSLGCLVVEMLTGAHPWANLTQMQAIFRIGSSIRPTVPDDISSEADDFLEQTFEIEHTDRPPAKELLQHAFIRDPDAWAASQQTPTRATFSQQQQHLQVVTSP
ncbi:hypothetical protein JCM10207_008223 [Rhodosporidiobolus poonsookiae]